MDMVLDFEENHNKSIKNLNVFSPHTPVICKLLHLLYHTLILGIYGFCSCGFNQLWIETIWKEKL